MAATQKPPQRSTRVILLAVAVALSFIGCHYARLWLKPTPADTPLTRDQPTDFQRVIGLSPSIVEVIYQLGLNDRLVGVSRFCYYPPEAKQKPVVGGYVDLDYEAVLGLKPDCVILLEEQESLATRLNAIGIHTIILDHASTQGVIESISVIGKAFDKEIQAGEIIRAMQKRIRTLTQPLHHGHNKKNRPLVLVCIDRDTSSDHPDRVIAAGNKGVHQEYLTMIGAINAYQGPVAYPLLSREKLIHLDPDIIIDLIREDTWKKKGRDTLLRQWQAYGELKAVKNNRLVFLHEHKHMIPGPRFIDTLEIFVQAAALTHE